MHICGMPLIPTYRAPYHYWYDALEGLPPKYPQRKVLNARETLSSIYIPPTAALISQATYCAHAPPPRITPFRILELSCHTASVAA